MGLHHARTRPAFTLVEMLVTIGVMAIVAGTLYGFSRAITGTDRMQSGVNSISVVAGVARAYATRDLTRMNNAGGFLAYGPTSGYNGAALIFAPDNTIRVVENYGEAERWTALATREKLESLGWNGYRDVPGRDYMQLPDHLGVVGIAFDRDINPVAPPRVYFFTPPFAVKLDEHGHVVPGRVVPNVSVDPAHAVVYESDDPLNPSRGTWDYTRTRAWWETPALNPANPTGQPYNPDLADPSRAPGLTVSPRTGTYQLPFQALETVAAVVVYDRKRLSMALDPGNPSLPLVADPADLLDSSGVNPRALRSETMQWLDAVDPQGKLVHARMLFFNRYSGALIREEMDWVVSTQR